jgi:hypothetical protein
VPHHPLLALQHMLHARLCLVNPDLMRARAALRSLRAAAPALAAMLGPAHAMVRRVREVDLPQAEADVAQMEAYVRDRGGAGSGRPMLA